jgi:subtilisin family serine protease
MLRVLRLVVLLVLALPASASADDTVDLIVRRDPGLTAAERADVRADAGVALEHRLRLSDTEVVSVPASEAAEALRTLRADPDVRWAQRDGQASAQASTFSDPYWSFLWGLENTGQTVNGVSGTADADMDVASAWTLATGADVTVAVVDTGVDAGHEDLAGAVAVNAGETGGGKETNGVDDDGDGLVDDWRGYDFIYGDNNPSDVKGHGSHVTGTIAARNANSIGITGLAPDAKVLMLKALGDDGFGAWSVIADAFDFAGDQGIRVVNASLGGAGSVPVIDDVIAQHPNTLYVVSAGNDSANLDTSTYYPCEAPEANVLCVGASDNRDEPASFTNFSPTAVDVFAPGVSVLSTTGSSYWFYNGTSMAAPHVSAEAALLLQRDPTLTAAQVKAAIVDSAEPKAALSAYGFNGGRANARAALDLISPAPDADGDGVADASDNCAGTANASQADSDGDGAGNACDAAPNHDDRDADGDAVKNADDNCPANANATQADADADGRGDACDSTPRGVDADGDTLGALDDNCPSVFNADQGDVDGDGVGDACDPSPRGGDGDGDGIADIDDACPLVAGPGGCPVAAPPEAATLTAPRVTAKRCGHRVCQRSLAVRAVATGASRATVSVSSEKCVHKRCSWRLVTTRAYGIRSGVLAAVLAVKLPAGRVKVAVTASGAGAPASRTASLTLR